MSIQKNLITLCFATVFTLGLAACGSNGSDDEMAGTPPMVDGDGDTRTSAETLTAAQAGYDVLTGESTDEERAAALMALENALMLDGNEAAYVAYLEEKLADQKAALAAAAAKEASAKASAKAGLVLKALDPMKSTPAALVALVAPSSGDVTATSDGYTMSANAPEEITGWRGVILEKDGAEARVYTNIKDAAATPIGGIYDSSSAPGKPDVYGVVAVVNEDTNTYSIPWSVAKRADDKSATTGDGPTATTTYVGSVRGLAGTFSCTGAAACTPPSDTTIGKDPGGGTWTFVPAVADGTIDVADENYLQFGWWLDTMGTGGEYEFDAFASASTGMGPVVDRIADSVKGSASYKGGAAGKWAIASTTENTNEGGHFTAIATLTANFDANTAAGNETEDQDGVSISGAITDFMTGHVSRDSWKVTLKAPAVTTNRVGPISADTEWKTGGAVNGMGVWSANFYGGDDTTPPTAATGVFNAAIGAGEIARISGAFGATKQ